MAKKKTKKATKKSAEEVVEAEETVEPVVEAEETVESKETEAAASTEETASTEVTSPEEETEAEAAAASELTLGSGAPADKDEDEEPKPAPVIRGKIDKNGVAIGTGRRKTAVARVRITKGNGELTINGRSLEEYFKTDRDRNDILAPLRATESEGKVKVWVRVNGGGTTGQAGAVVLGIARALEAMDPSLHHRLSEEGYLTRDGRMVERKKYGLRKARRSFQFSKR